SESSLALRSWFGASPRLVWCWRRALGVVRHNEGSLRLQRINAQAGADALRGKALSPQQVERRRPTAIQLDLGRHLQPCPRPNGSRPWTDAELALLGTLHDYALALRLWRSVNAVCLMRERRGIAPLAHQGGWEEAASAGQPWTKEEDDLVRRLAPREAAA